MKAISFYKRPFVLRSLFFLLILFFNNALYGQQAVAIRSLNTELGKNGLVVNLYYDHKIRNKNYGFRIGIGSNFAKYVKEITASGGGYYLFGKNGNFFETGLDAGYLSIEENSNDQKGFSFLMPDNAVKSFYESINLGYRLIGNKFIFRIGVSPGIIKNEFIPGAYSSIGVIL